MDNSYFFEHLDANTESNPRIHSIIRDLKKLSQEGKKTSICNKQTSR